MESLQQRREELERKEYQLKESLLKFDKFLKENNAKKDRWEKMVWLLRNLLDLMNISLVQKFKTFRTSNDAPMFSCFYVFMFFFNHLKMHYLYFYKLLKLLSGL